MLFDERVDTASSTDVKPGSNLATGLRSVYILRLER